MGAREYLFRRSFEMLLLLAISCKVIGIRLKNRVARILSMHIGESLFDERCCKLFSWEV